MLTKVSDGIAKTIFVTSTFLTKERLLFRQILRLVGSIVVGMDFRNPRLNEYMVVQEQGVTNYLSSNDLDLNDLIVNDGYKNFHTVSGCYTT
jgi:hypothetical protein